MIATRRGWLVPVMFVIGLFMPTAGHADPQTFHLVAVNEVYTNADGTLQFVELMARSSFQTELEFTRLEAVNADGSTTTLLFDFTAAFSWTNGQTMLLATQGVADALGFAPDFIIPSGAISITNGRVIFNRDPSVPGGPVDAVAYGAYTGSNSGFGSPAMALPSDGSHSLQRVVYNLLGAGGVPNNATDWTVACNSPRNHAGQTGHLTGPAQPPLLAPIGPKATNQGQLLSFNDSATDPDCTTPSLTAEDLPSGATFIDHANGTGTFSWTPSPTQFGDFPVRFLATNGTLQDTELVHIAVNAIPVARDTTVTASEDVATAARLQAYDPDGDPLTYAILSAPSHGQASALNPATGEFTFLGSTNYTGPDSLTFKATDNDAKADSGVVHFVIAAVNDPPVAGDLAVSVLLNTPHSVGPMPATDVDNASWTITQLSSPFHGTVSNFNGASGAFDYTPNLGYTGPDSIKYHANDGQADSDTGTVRFTVSLTCACSCHSDPQCDSVASLQDVVRTVNVAFRGGASEIDPSGSCPKEETDVDCSGFTTVQDVVRMVNVTFRGANRQTEFCQPCP